MHKGLVTFGNETGQRPHAIALVGLGLAGLVGAAVPLYASAIDEGLGRLAILPALIFLCLVLIYSRKLLLLLIIFFRASADLVFDLSKLSLGGHQIGVGALVNASVLAIAVSLVLENPHLLPKKQIAVTWGAFLVVTFLATLFTPANIEAVRTYLAILSYLAIFTSAFYFVRSPAGFRYCVRVVVWSSVIPALYVFVEVATGGAHRVDGFRLQSTFSHPNIFAFYLTLVISFILYLIKSGEGLRSREARIGLSVYMLYLLGLLVLTQTRSAWGACFMVFALYGLMFERRYLLYLMVIPAAALLIPGVLDRFMELAAGNDTYAQYARLNSFAWRRLMWESSLSWMHPGRYFFGYGLDSFQFYSPVFFPLAGNVNPGAHSVYVQCLFEIGIIGLAAYFWLYGRLLWCLREMGRMDKLGAFVAIALVVEYLVVSFSDNMLEYLSFNWYFWFMVGAACSVVTAGTKSRPEARRAVPAGFHPGLRENPT